MDRDQTIKHFFHITEPLFPKSIKDVFKLLKHKYFLKKWISVRKDAPVISKSNSELEIKRPESP